MSKPKMTLQFKVQKEMPEFVDSCASLSVEELNGRLAQLAKDEEAVEESKEADEELETQRVAALEMAAPYRDAVKAIKLKRRYIVGLVKEKGGAA